MEDYNYDALAINTEIEDIPYISENNKGILRRLRENDLLDNLWIYDDDVAVDSDSEDNIEYFPGNNDEELGWLGYYLGRNTSLQELCFLSRTIHDADFYIGLNRNQSIKMIRFHYVDLRDGNIFQMMNSFFKNNNNLTLFESVECDLGSEDVRQLSLALGVCNKSLERIRLSYNQVEDGQMVDVILH